MRLLREYIRRVLLTEAAKGPEDLPPGWKVAIEKSSAYIGVSLFNDSGKYEGQLRAHKQSDWGPCLDAFFVGWSEASTQGWGPMLYDIAMEVATELGSALMSDRSTVSGDAHSVWDYYLDNRGDVETLQLDTMDDLLTPEQEDNCAQSSFDKKVAADFPGMGKAKEAERDLKRQQFLKSPLTKAYRKKNQNTIRYLEDNDLVKYSGEYER